MKTKLLVAAIIFWCTGVVHGFDIKALPPNIDARYLLIFPFKSPIVIEEVEMPQFQNDFEQLAEIKKHEARKPPRNNISSKHLPTSKSVSKNRRRSR